MCNAWNHEPFCQCGFGGENDTSRDGGFGGQCRPSYQRYVNPFAKCPVCGVPVFFFQDANGGRVFFDELGPPWPKHPCTDRSAEYRRDPINFLGASSSRRDQPDWVKEGWLPFILDSSSFDRRNMRYHLSGRLSSGGMVWAMIETKWMRKASAWLDWVKPDSPTFFRRTDGYCEFSGITLGGERLREHYFRGL